VKIDSLRFNDDGLIPAVVQDARSKEVLTLAYMNKESLHKTIETKETWFYSRSREELWHKGATSGNTQTVARLQFLFVITNDVRCTESLQRLRNTM